MNIRGRVPVILLALGAAFALLAGSLAACSEEEPPPLKVGLMLSFGDSPSETTLGRQRAFDLAIKHINEGGGVFGQPVEVAVGDASAPGGPAAEARRLIEEEGVHAIVGPSSSADSLAVIEVTGPAGIPTISPSASSPRLSTAGDRDFFFRTVLSDIAQGPILAQLALDRGYERVGLLYRDDAWGKGLANTFQEAWRGELIAVAVAPDQESYLSELERSASGTPEALVLITFGTEGAIIVAEAIEEGLYDQFVFGDALRRPELIDAIGGAHLGGMYGVAGAYVRDTASAKAWEAAALAEYGEVPELTYIRQTYDATIAIALAAQAAGSVDGAAIRDELRGIGAAPGETVIAGPEGAAEALRILGDGGEVDYQGAAGTLDWDENGDLSRGAIGIWRFTADGAIEDVDVVVYER